MLIKDAEVWGHGRADVRLQGERIVAIGALEGTDQRAIEAEGALLLPGLHDHHLHLAAMAAEHASVPCGPPRVCDADGLAAALAMPGEGWIRGIGYHESVMGLPTRRGLDRIAPHRPLRIQHRSGRLWLLNSAAIETLLAGSPAPPGLDLATGHLFDEDRWLRDALGSRPPEFSVAGAELAAWGVTGITDMSPANDPAMASHFAAEMRGGSLPQRVVLAGSIALGGASEGPWQLGPAKLHLHEAALPDFDAAVGFVDDAHAQDRPVAVHCVSEVELVFALAALEAAGSRPGDRIEHASVASNELIARVAALGMAVCVQPGFVRERGDAYLRYVEPRHRDELYRLRAFWEAGVTMAGGSDAPFGSADPWAAMAAAVERTTVQGAALGLSEALTADEALQLYLADPLDLARRREIAVGGPADVCLLDRSWVLAAPNLAAVSVRATWISGRLVHDRVDHAPGQC